jgi:hypothetical protein
MNILRIVAAVFVMLVLLYVARTTSMGHPEHLIRTDGAYTFETTTVPKIAEQQTDTIRVIVTGPMDYSRLYLRTSLAGNLPPDSMHRYSMVQMTPNRQKPGEFYYVARAGDRGGLFHYYFAVIGPAGDVVAKLVQEDGLPFTLKYIGEVPKLVLAGHLLFMFVTVFCVALASIDALKVIRGSQDIRPMAVGLFWAAVFCFLGGYPLGIPMNYYAFNGGWEGVPFGTDATDNKTQLLLIYLIFAAIATLGSFSRGRFGRDLFAPRTRGWIGLSTFAVMLFIYLIPHSIQFSPRFTYVFCYSWIAVVAALYVFGRLKSRTASH